MHFFEVFLHSSWLYSREISIYKVWRKIVGIGFGKCQKWNILSVKWYLTFKECIRLLIRIRKVWPSPWNGTLNGSVLISLHPEVAVVYLKQFLKSTFSDAINLKKNSLTTVRPQYYFLLLKLKKSKIVLILYLLMKKINCRPFKKM